MKTIIFFDFDGTLFSHKIHAVPFLTVKAFQEMAKNPEIITCLLSGRSKSELSYFDFSGIKFDYFGLLNGQLIYDANFNILYSNDIQGEMLKNTIEIFNEKKVSMSLSEEDDFYINKLYPTMVTALRNVGNPLPIEKEYSGNPIYLVSLAYKDETEKKMILERIGPCYAANWNPYAIDIVPVGADKANGVRTITNMLNIDIKNTISFGDGDNDVPLIKACNIGIAVNGSCQELKDCADYICEDIEDGGIYYALKRYKII